MFTNPFPSSKPDMPRSVPKWVTYMVTRLGTEYGSYLSDMLNRLIWGIDVKFDHVKQNDVFQFKKN